MATTKHTGTLTFGRCAGADRHSCPRCAELDGGAPAVAWRPSRRQQDAQRVAEIARHDCRASRCASVCTFGAW
jgi:hypothetical protein